MTWLDAYGMRALEVTALSLMILMGIGVLWLVALYIIDRTQTTQTIRHNYPIIGRFRYFFEHMGTFFRQYFFAMDREELPFNRAERSWVYRAAKNVDSTVAFGSTRPLSGVGAVMFANCAFPTQESRAEPASHLTLGAGYARQPYTAKSIFNISGMSYGALSKAAVTALSKGAAKAGIWMNTGEGGLSPYHLAGGADLVFQIGTAKYGVRNEHGHLSDDRLRTIAGHEQVKMFEIKFSQGTKPGKGGILPAIKVNEEIAEIRGIPAGHDSISPNGHEEVNNVDDMLDLVSRVRDVTGKPTGMKLVVGQFEFFDDLFAAIHRRGFDTAPDFITIDSADGGTGAAPQSLMDYVGLPINESLPVVVDKLNEYGLRERIRVVVSGKLITPAGVAWALCMGADFVLSARGFLFSLGCIQALQCNKNTCPTGITTHNPELMKGLDPTDKAERVAHYAHNMMHEVEIIAHSVGVKEPRQFNRKHAREVTESGRSKRLDELYPNVHTRPEYRIPLTAVEEQVIDKITATVDV